MAKEYEREVYRLYKGMGELTQDASIFQGAPIAQDASIASQSRILLNRLGEKWATRFREASATIVDKFINQLSRDSEKKVEMSLKELSGGIALTVPKMPAGLRDKMIAATAENVSLIKSIPAQYHRQIEGAVMRSIEAGGDTQKLFKDIKHYNQVTDKRAKLIANDQTRKATSAMNRERMKSAGVTKWRWVHSGGGAEPRELHKNVLNGKVFSYNEEPPIIDERTGERGYPGQLINCRCVQIPVVSFDTDADELMT